MIISVDFCLFGDYKKYLNSLYKNIIRLQKERIFTVTIHIDNSVEDTDIEDLQNFEVKIVKINFRARTVAEGMMLRYKSILNNLSDISIIRDADSLITSRELRYLRVWFNSKFLFHVIRDNSEHTMPIMGGLFGIKKDGYKLFSQLYRSNCMNYQGGYGLDQYFLSDIIYPRFVSEAIIFSSCIVYLNENVFDITMASNKRFIGSYANSYSHQKRPHKKYTIFNYYLLRLLSYRGLRVSRIQGWFFINLVNKND
jgi:hypothetical protein